MRVVQLAACVVLATVLGCRSSAPELHPVTGKVVFKDGRPVQGAMVEFAVENGFGARGKTDSDGRFELATGGQKGAVVGAHRVAVVQMVVADGAAAHAKAHHGWLAIHPKYAAFDTSGLIREVKAGPNDFTIELDPAAEKPGGW
jgi:hypothetical protein